MEIFKLFGSIFVNNDEANQSIFKTEEKAEKAGGALSKMGSVAKGMGQAVAAVGTAALGAATALGGIAMKSSDAASRVNDMAQVLGLSNQAFQEWDYIMNLNGASIDSFSVGMKTLQQKMIDLGEGNKEATKLFEDLGISFEEVQDASPEQAMEMVIKKMQEMPESAKKSDLALQAFGKQGMQLLPVLNMTAEETENLKNTAHELGMVMSDEMITAGDDFGDVLDTAKGMIGGFANKMGAELLPAMTKGIEAFIALATGTEGAQEKMQVAMENIVNTIADKIPSFVEAGANIITNLAVGIVRALPGLMEKVVGIIPQLISTLGKGISDVLPIIKPVTDAISFLAKNFDKLLAAVTPVVAGFVAFKAVLAIQAAITGLKTAITAATAVMELYAAGASAATVSSMAMGTGTKLLSTIMALFSGKITLATAATTLFGNALKIASGPIGIAVGVIAALGTGVALLIGWLNKQSDTTKRLNEETQNLKDSTDGLKNSVSNTKNAHDDNIRSIEAETGAAKRLAEEVYDLAEVENKTAEEKQRLAALVETLNGSMEGLNLQYDAENDALSKTQDEIGKLIEARAEQARAAAAQERAVEIAKEQILVEEQLNQIHSQRKNWGEAYERGEVKAKDYNKAIQDLESQELELSGQNQLLSESFAHVTEIIADSVDLQSAAIDRQAEVMRISAEAQQKALESLAKEYTTYKDKATNMFDAISDKSEMTIKEMTGNLETNQRVISEWADNISKLAKRGIDSGLLDTLRAAGPESAGYVAELVKAQDDELQKLSDAYANGGDVAKKALAKSLGINTEVVDAAADLADSSAQSLKKELEEANFPEIGRNVAKGLANGITKGIPFVEAAAQKMGKAAENATRTVLKIQSPSKLFASLGKFTGEGFVAGVEGMKSSVQKAVDDVFGGLDKDLNPTITVNDPELSGRLPELDLTMHRQVWGGTQAALWGMSPEDPEERPVDTKTFTQWMEALLSSVSSSAMQERIVDILQTILSSRLGIMLDTAKVAELLWEAFENAAARRGRIFAPTQQNIARLAKTF